jgi:hypothetical protein
VVAGAIVVSGLRIVRRGAHGARDRRLPQAAGPASRSAPLHRPPRAVPRGHLARAGSRAGPRAGGPDRSLGPGRRRAHTPRARCRAAIPRARSARRASQRRLTAAAAATARSTRKYPT